MLIEFCVANFRSIREKQTLSLVKAHGDELAATNIAKVTAVQKFELLRSAAIYGPNAGGKSNLLLAMRTMQRIVIESATRQRGDDLPVTPFRLSDSTVGAPSEFEATFIVDGVRYQYGFASTDKRIHEEWLIAYPKGRAQHWFSRLWNSTDQEYQWHLGTQLAGEKLLWKNTTRENALFLSTAVQLNSRQLQPIYDWFKTYLHTTDVDGWAPGFSASLCEGEEKKKILSFLKGADIDIDDILIEKEPFDPKSLPEEMPDSVRQEIITRFKDKHFIEINTVHKSSEGKDITFDIDDESDGTQKLFAFAGPWIDSLANGYVLFIDELNNSLHPKLVEYLVRLFHSNKTNPLNAQLIFTTHETSILNQNLFRRDQVWFCERGNDKSTTLTPLTDFKPRKGRENLEAAYLSGRYGALPYVRPARNEVAHGK